MSKREKFAGGTGGTRAGTTTMAASHASRTYAHLSPSTSNVGDNRVVDVTTPGTKPATSAISSHNDINKFTSGISMHHPYKNRGGAFDQNKQAFQGNPASRSHFTTPSGGGNKARASQRMGSTRRPQPYDDIMVENSHPSDPSKRGGSPSGPRGGTRALMNRMKNAKVNKMGWK